MDASNVNVLDLTGGGTVSLVSSGDGDYYLLVTIERASFSIAVSNIDVLGLRALTGDVVMKDIP